MLSDRDLVAETRELLNFRAPMAWSDQAATDELVNRAPELLRALADEVDRLRDIEDLWERIK
ncbi:MAG TPA: hypothetical protein VF290_02470 [Pyrinomonadaceae bacterium]